MLYANVIVSCDKLDTDLQQSITFVAEQDTYFKCSLGLLEVASKIGLHLQRTCDPVAIAGALVVIDWQ